jgi:hypothetical protein
MFQKCVSSSDAKDDFFTCMRAPFKFLCNFITIQPTGNVQVFSRLLNPHDCNAALGLAGIPGLSLLVTYGCTLHAQSRVNK